ncbi:MULTISPECIES: GNAT family N-acetyltransferase [unclassified Streptomyces]|uniref:GNAT family N-acetyltransferase n=1 Tax=unclassified Streptomyces TaxID=2593676 RepID=UPI000700B334|nr:MULTISPECIES: GNAT family N-acetyltransferase [unclassified Streptomyces]KQX58801.1 acetyltransferase [Streptomyces sp. Root1304]KRB00062.1 acetyltransferase [Streptomyces sp. Root66D1]
MEFTGGGRLEVRITGADVGKRVSVRYVTESPSAGGRFTDAVGVLTSWDNSVLLITRKSGEGVRIAESALVAGKVVPAAPARRRGPSATFRELALATAHAWQPVESEPLGEWTLRAAFHELPPEGRPGGAVAGRRVGFTRRANSALPLGDPGMPTADALSRVRAWYEARKLPPYVQAATGAEGTQELLCAALDRHGWRREVSAEVRIAALAPIGDLDADVSAVRLSRTVDEAWLRRYQRSGEPSPAVRSVLSSGPSVWFASVAGTGGVRSEVTGEVSDGVPGGVPAAIGRCVVDGRWAGFMAVEVDPEQRRRGLATAVMTALARKALDEGASAAWLQVESDNDGARALYDGMGFAPHHHYHHYRWAEA